MIEAILGFLGAFFVLGGFWFYILFLVYFGSIIALADHEQNAWAGIITAAFFFAILQFNPTITIDWSFVPWLIMIYAICGVVMSYIKWISYLKFRAQKYVDLKQDFRDYYNDANPDDKILMTIDKNTSMKEVLNAQQFDNFGKWLKDEEFLSSKEKRIIPQWKDKQSQLVSWALWWPAVIFWMVANDYIVGFFQGAVRATRKYYEAVAAKIFSNSGVSVDENDEIRW